MCNFFLFLSVNINPHLTKGTQLEKQHIASLAQMEFAVSFEDERFSEVSRFSHIISELSTIPPFSFSTFASFSAPSLTSPSCYASVLKSHRERARLF